MARKKLSMQQIIDKALPTAPPHEVEAAGPRIWKRIEEELKKHDTSLRSLTGDGWSVGPVTDREFLVLTAVSDLGECHILQVLPMVESWSGGFNVVHISLLLDGLRIREFVTARWTDAAVDGDRRQLFQITDEGGRALRRARQEGKSVVSQEREVKGGNAERAR